MINVIMRKWFVILCVLTLRLSSDVVISLTYCHRGSYYLIPNRGSFVCPLCPPGTFMPFHDHKYTECFDCMKVEDDTLEILITPCNGTHDAVIHCVPGYYRRQPRNTREKERCEKCSDCKADHEILPCRSYDDVHCCHSENSVVLPNRNGVPVCVERPWLCRGGAYFNTEYFQCSPCPADTYMSLDYHSSTECLKCYPSSRESLPKHGIIIQPCNKTHQAVVGCEEGFYINHTMGNQKKDIGCSPCKICSPENGPYEGRECGRAQDTVCCPRPNMTVVDTPGGPQCKALIEDGASVQNTTMLETTVCGKDEYMYIEDKEDKITIFTTCKLCPRGTFMDESRHNSTSCKNCKEFMGDSPPPSCPQVVIRGKQGDTHVNAGAISAFFTTVALLLFASCLAARYLPPLYIMRFLLFCRRGRKWPPNNMMLDVEEPLLKQPSRDMTGHHEICLSADEPQIRESKCQNKVRHQEYITIADFHKRHLPKCWQYLKKYIRAVADLTVKLSVKKISENRPLGYPLYKLKGKHGLTAYGSGMIMHVTWFPKKGNRTCPCRSRCDKPWGEVEVFSANHVLFDDFECQHTICELGYDTEEDRDSCQKMEVVGLRYNNVEIDYCILRCVTHDKNLIDRLEKKIQTFRSFKECKNESEDVEPTAVIVSHPHGMSKRISVGRLLRREEVAPYKFVYETQACEGSGGAPVCILGEGGAAAHMIALHSGQTQAGENQSGGTVLL